MSQVMRNQERLETLEGQARDLLVSVKALEECEAHAGTYIDKDDPDAMKRAYALGTNMVKNGQVDGTREEFMDAIKSAQENAGDECYSCAKHRDE